jgi:ATP-binding cassette subfamily F protein 3
MSIINLINISHDYGNKLLFENINLSFDNQTKGGLVGRNGTGKTTLFHIIMGNLSPYKGKAHIARGYRVGYFTQNNSFSSKDFLWDWLYHSRTDIIEKAKELNDVEHLLTLSSDEKLLKKYHDLQTEYELLGGYNYENELKSMLLTFSFTQRDYQRPIDDFSGGEKTRIRLISILLNKYDFILFDEPTNHLDLMTVDWFIEYLRTLPCGYLIISHDRYLLDQVTNKIYELINQKIETYTGNYSSYLLQSTERDALLQKQYKQQQKFIEKTEDFIRKNMAGQKTNQAKSRLKMLNRMERIEVSTSSKAIKLHIHSENRSGNDIFRLKDISIGFQGLTLASDVNLSLHYRDKVCLVGANGSGKTTLLRCLTGELDPLSGDLWVGHNLSVGYFDQHHIELDNEITVLDTIWDLAPGETFGYIMSYLARFGFYEDMIDQKVGSISGGEKSRLYLAQLIHSKPNLLILDEPTNHLDISMIESLEVALKTYEGTIILVSHDRYFINAITNQFWIIKDRGIRYATEFSVNSLEPQSRQQKVAPSETIAPEKQSISSPKKKANPYLLNKLLSEIQSIERSIQQAEQTISDIQSKFSDATFYAEKDNITQANTQLKDLRDDIKSLTLSKDELETQYINMLE